MITKLTKQGSSWVLVVDEPALDATQVDSRTTALQAPAVAETPTIAPPAGADDPGNITADVELS